MTTPFSVTPLSGVDLVTISSSSDIADGLVSSARLGEQVFGSDGKLYVYGQANGTISATNTTCTVNATTFLATNSGGNYTSPGTAMAAGDRAWFGKSSV